LRKPVLALCVLVLAAATTLGLAACGSSGKEGGTLTGSYANFPDYLDPAFSYSQEGWTAMYDTYLPLLTYKHANGEEGSEVVPALAEDMPEVSKDGKTYTLTLHQGLEYSDGKPVKASDFKSSIERLFLVNSPGISFYEGIVGAGEFAQTKKGDISGIKTDDGTGKITIELTEPRGTFTNELGMLFAAVLPSGTPAKNLTANPPPATGPYQIAGVEPGRAWSYKRNPAWKANGALVAEVPDGHFDKIKLTVVRNDSTQVSEVEQDKTMWMQTPPPADSYAEIKDKYEGTQFRVEHPINLYFFWMNTSKAPFDDVKVRQAVNYAVDPAALERIYSGTLAAAHQILPEGMPGHEAFDLYPHDMAKAKKLIAEADPSDREITVWTNDEDVNKEAGVYYNGVLEELGFDTTLKVINASVYFPPVVGSKKTPDLDTGWFNWYQDYPNPNDFFGPLLAGESIQPVFNTNLAQIDVPRLNEKIAKLSTEQLGPEQEAEYAALDREYMELAPWVPYGTSTVATFVDSEIELDKVIFNPTFGHDLTSFQLK
jgi:peptide/nickel transport system substrate-binding protein